VDALDRFGPHLTLSRLVRMENILLLILMACIDYRI
jgi:hypothetical protein